MKKKKQTTASEGMTTVNSKTKEIKLGKLSKPFLMRLPLPCFIRKKKKKKNVSKYRDVSQTIPHESITSPIHKKKC